jgi:hypothetical protein
MKELWVEAESLPFPREMAAVFVLVGLLNIHPYIDGNGRCARTWYCLLLERTLGRRVFVPLRRFIELSSGGFELRLREAEVFGRWTPLVQYLTLLNTLAADPKRAPLGKDSSCG